MHNRTYKYKNVVAALAIVAIPHSTMAQVEGSALDHMLQRPRVSKVFKHKKPFDHLFIDAGAGANFLGTRTYSDAGLSAEIGIGDWITPEHGFRINLNGGEWRIGDVHPKYMDLALDYLLNITAVATPGTYYTPRTFEVIGTMGVDYGWSRNQGIRKNGFGVHIGLRGQLAMSKYSYVYLEPRFGLIEDDVTQFANVHDYRPYANIYMGFGYRLPESRLKTPGNGQRSLTDGLFFSVMGGPAFLSNSDMSSWGERFGGRMTASFGKWLDSYNALRLSANATSIYQYESRNNIKALGLQLDYMANLNNIFGGVNPERRFWVDMVAGVSYNVSSDEITGHRGSFGYGAGLQANLRLARGLTLSIEPRVDVYTDKYAPATYSFDNRDITGTILAGLTYTYNDRRTANVTDADDIHHNTVTFVAGMANRLPNMGNSRLYAPMGRISFARWYSPAFAWRANVQGLLRGSEVTGHKLARATAGADWMTDLTALTCGYDVTRAVAFKTVAGFNVGLDYSYNERRSTYFSPDVHMGMQMAVRLNNSLHIVAEPQVAYLMSKRMSPAICGRFMPSLAVGLEYSMRQSDRKAESIDTPTKNDFVSVAIGTGFYTGNYGMMNLVRNRLSFVGEVGYGHWMNGISGIHASIGNATLQRLNCHNNQNITSLSAGYMMNVKAAATGEPTEGDLVQVTGIADLSLVGSKIENHDMKVSIGGKLALQTGFRVSKSMEIYAEPSVMIYTKNVETDANSPHPVEGELRLSIGTKYNF